jgi:hypothetical protein
MGVANSNFPEGEWRTDFGQEFLLERGSGSKSTRDVPKEQSSRVIKTRFKGGYATFRSAP